MRVRAPRRFVASALAAYHMQDAPQASVGACAERGAGGTEAAKALDESAGGCFWRGEGGARVVGGRGGGAGGCLGGRARRGWGGEGEGERQAKPGRGACCVLWVP